MAKKRKAIPLDTKKLVLHEAGYRCANPACRTILTLDIHHLDPVSKGGGDGPDNLLALCPNCHDLHHNGIIPPESIRAWKFLLLAVNEAFDRYSLNLLLAIAEAGVLWVSGDGVLHAAALVGSGMATTRVFGSPRPDANGPWYDLRLSERGEAFLRAWKAGDQATAVRAMGGTHSSPPTSTNRPPQNPLVEPA